MTSIIPLQRTNVQRPHFSITTATSGETKTNRNRNFTYHSGPFAEGATPTKPNAWNISSSKCRFSAHPAMFQSKYGTPRLRMRVRTASRQTAFRPPPPQASFLIRKKPLTAKKKPTPANLQSLINSLYQTARTPCDE